MSVQITCEAVCKGDTRISTDMKAHTQVQHANVIQRYPCYLLYTHVVIHFKLHASTHVALHATNDKQCTS